MGEKFMLTGDCEKEGEAEFVEKVNEKVGKFAEFDDDYAVSVIKAGHHGSNTSSCDAFLDTVSAKIAAVSCGQNNDYGHPHKEVLTRLSERGTTVYRTDLQGSVVFATDGTEIAVHTERGAAE